MTRKTIIAKPEFIQAIKAEIEATKVSFNKIFSKINPETTEKLKKMNVQ